HRVPFVREARAGGVRSDGRGSTLSPREPDFKHLFDCVSRAAVVRRRLEQLFAPPLACVEHLI
ncbi:hypothetical protein, partial [Nocardioides abyssi]